MIKIVTDTGATLEMGVAPFKDCLKLKNVIFAELSKVGIHIDKIDIKNTDIESIIQPLMALDSSDSFYDAVMICAVRSKYNGDKITEELFESEKAREDYYRILIEVIKVNLSPFFKGLVSGLKHTLAGVTAPKVQK